MKIAYYTFYVGKEFTERYCNGKHYALSGTLKSQGIARSLLKAGYEVVIYSPGITSCNSFIPAFTEIEEYPEGKLIIKYSGIFSYRGCTMINNIILHYILKKEQKKYQYAFFLYYNIESGSYLHINLFKKSIRVLEFEDNIFNKSLEGNMTRGKWLKRKIYDYLINRTDAAIVVCNGMLDNNEVKYRTLIPGIINDDVIESVTNRVNQISADKPVKIILIGGVYYCKGPDLLIQAMRYVKHPCSVEFYSNEAFMESAKEYIKKIPALHSINIKGFLPHRTLIQKLDQSADILVNTTRSMGIKPQSAGFPFKMMEYASTGRPIISSEIGKLDDDYNSHITYYEGEDPFNIATCIDNVIENYDAKVSAALELQKRVISEYTIEGTSKKLKLFFTNILENESKIETK